ncbi:Conserved hypothetical protein [Shewanella piezotolerans WP3]|uniref:Lipoprotein n=1 Tax=Shewanella piezotolerans (strain WP3 / JCM 13877) TaxID=225849 RepID=B8CUJ4_SHEPW|nr:DUF4156 domain-containing protein [Shewanella piezotolerans]ACJ31186.1 Conserved hypothetical protein [Shewanella piezotolerans WP3]
MKKILIGFALIALTACSAHQLHGDAASIRIVDVEPQNCSFLGEVDGSQGNWFTADFTSDRDILIGARNEVKNQAAALGANVIVLKKSVDNSNEGIEAYGNERGAVISSTKGTYSSTVIGEAFNCPQT